VLEASAKIGLRPATRGRWPLARMTIEFKLNRHVGANVTRYSIEAIRIPLAPEP
jgi:hypothetical protein